MPSPPASRKQSSELYVVATGIPRTGCIETAAANSSATTR